MVKRKKRRHKHHRKNPGHAHHKKKHHTHRRRRRNPTFDLGAIKTIALAVGAGLAANVVASLALNALMPTSSKNTKDIALVGMAGGAAMFLGATPIAMGAAMGLLLPPATQLVANLLAPAAPAAVGLLMRDESMRGEAPAAMGLLMRNETMGDMGYMGDVGDVGDMADDNLLRKVGILR